MASWVRGKRLTAFVFSAYIHGHIFTARSFCTCLSFLPVCDSVIVATSGHSSSHERLQASYPLTNTSEKHRDARVSRLAFLESAQPSIRPPVWKSIVLHKIGTNPQDPIRQPILFNGVAHSASTPKKSLAFRLLPHNAANRACAVVALLIMPL